MTGFLRAWVDKISGMKLPVQDTVMLRCRLFSLFTAIATIMIGFLVLIGWALDLIVLKSVLSGMSPMKPNTAVCFVLLGSALYLLQFHDLAAQGMRQKRSAQIAAGLAAVVGLATLAEYVLAVDLGIDRLLFHHAVAEYPGIYPGRMAPVSALEFVILGASLLLMDAPAQRAPRLFQYLALTGTVLGLIALLGYAYGIPELYKVFPYSSVALSTAVLFTLFGLGILLARPDFGLMTTATSEHLGSVMARRILPLALILPFIIGWFRLQGERAGLYGTEFGLALFAACNVVIFTLLIWWTARSMNRVDEARNLINEQLLKTNAILERESVQRRRAEQALPEAHEQLQLRIRELARSNMDLQQFAYVASHDLQTPLRSINGFLQLLSDNYRGKLDAQADEWIDRTIASTQRMQQLIRDLLEYSRVDSRVRPFEKVDCAAVFDETMELLAPSVREIGGQATRGDLPTVLGDRSLLSQLLQNLISNAIKYHGSEPLRVHVSAEKSGGKWLFSVRDNGIGIEPKQHDRIFQIFRRLHTEQAYPGTGIGLAICQRIVHFHGGAIWVKSQLQAGSTFYFTIPERITSGRLEAVA
jgi:signal transduction histidine kinase